MPRNARIDIPGLLQYVIVRGIEKRQVLLDDQDRVPADVSRAAKSGDAVFREQKGFLERSGM
ncbi:MAG TPA: hypothetical protein PLD93_04580 [Synergistaceae bacterium]|nr:hypothetical protein [Geobacteraceae bacterium]HPR90689.1 hypothetical protein [Synergistaceae bacterium]